MKSKDPVGLIWSFFNIRGIEGDLIKWLLRNKKKQNYPASESRNEIYYLSGPR